MPASACSNRVLAKMLSWLPCFDCTGLQELYLRKNEVSEIGELNYLTGLPNLKARKQAPVAYVHAHG